MDETITKLYESMAQQSQIAAINGINPPEFSGRPKEDVNEFLKRYENITFALNEENKCLLLKKALVGSASIWAEDNINELIKAGNWIEVKRKLVDRFEIAEDQQRYQQKLASMHYDPNVTTLRSYIEEFAACFKKAHKGADDKSIIGNIAQNLPDDVRFALSIASDSWRQKDKLDDLYVIVKRVEQTLLPYAPKEKDTSAQIDTNRIAKLFKDMQDNFKKDCIEAIKKETQKADKEEIVAAVGLDRTPNKSGSSNDNNGRATTYRNTRFSPNKYDNSRFNGNRSYANRNQFKANQYNQDRFSRNFTRNNSYPGNKNFQAGTSRDDQVAAQAQPLLPRAASNNSEPASQVNKSSPQDLAEAYYKKHGKPPSPCWFCQGDHYNRHCPYQTLN